MSKGAKMLRDLGIKVPRGTVVQDDGEPELSPVPDRKWLSSREGVPLLGRHASTFFAAASTGKIKSKMGPDGKNKVYERSSILATREAMENVEQPKRAPVPPIYVGPTDVRTHHIPKASRLPPIPETTPSPSPIDGLLAWVAEGKKHDYFRQREELLKKL